MADLPDEKGNLPAGEKTQQGAPDSKNSAGSRHSSESTIPKKMGSRSRESLREGEAVNDVKSEHAHDDHGDESHDEHDSHDDMDSDEDEESHAHSDVEDQRVPTRTSSTHSRPVSVIPRSKRRGLLGRFSVIPEVDRPYDYSRSTKWMLTGVVSMAGAVAPFGSSIFYRKFFFSFFFFCRIRYFVLACSQGWCLSCSWCNVGRIPYDADHHQLIHRHVHDL